MDERKGLTLWFDIDVGVIEKSPFTTETPYGIASIAARGCTFDERDNLQDLLDERDAFIVKHGLWEEFTRSLTPPRQP